MTIHMPKINISNGGGGGGGGGETTEVYLTDISPTLPEHPVSRGDKYYDTDEKLIYTSLIDSPIGYQDEFCDKETPKYGVFYIHNNLAYVWNGEDLVRYTASNNYVSLENKPMINDQTLIGNEDGEHYGLVDKDTFLNKLYPTGTILFTYTKVSPATYIGGTWELIEEGYYPVATTKDTIESRLLGEELPNIKGMLNQVPSRGVVSKSGVFSDTTGQGSVNWGGGSGNDNRAQIYFNASQGQVNSDGETFVEQSNSVYKDGGKVQPKSVLLYMWRRIDSGQLTYNFVNLSFSASDFNVDQATGQVSLRNGIYYYTPNEIPKADENGKLISSGVNINDIVLNTRRVAGIPLDRDITATEIQTAIKDIAITLTNKSIDADDNVITNLETENMKASALARSTDNVRDYDNSVDTKVTTEKFIQKVLKNIPTPTGANDAVNKSYVDSIVPPTPTSSGVVVLLAIASEKPTEPVRAGSKYFNTSTRLIYTADEQGYWGSTGVAPSTDTLYRCDDELYIYTGYTLQLYPTVQVIDNSGDILPSADGYNYSYKFFSRSARKIYSVENFVYALQNYNNWMSSALPAFDVNTGIATNFTKQQDTPRLIQSNFNEFNDKFRKPWSGTATYRLRLRNLLSTYNSPKLILLSSIKHSSMKSWCFYYDQKKLFWGKVNQNITTYYVEEIVRNEGILLADYAMRLENKDYYITVDKNSDGTCTTTIRENGYYGNILHQETVSCPDYTSPDEITNSYVSYGCISIYDDNMQTTEVGIVDSFGGEIFTKKVQPSSPVKNWKDQQDLIEGVLYLDKTNKKIYCLKNNELLQFNARVDDITDLLTDENKESETLTDTTQISKIDTTTKKNIIYKLSQVWDYILGKIQPLLNNKANRAWYYVGILGATAGSTITIPENYSDWKEMTVIMRVQENTAEFVHNNTVLRNSFELGASATYVIFNYGLSSVDTGTIYAARSRLTYNATTRVLTNSWMNIATWRFMGIYIFVR